MAHKYTAPTSRKNRKILERLQNIKRFTTKTPRKFMDKLVGSLQKASFRIPGGGRAVSTYTGRAEGHTPVVARHTRPNTMYQILGGNYKTHGKTHHSGLPAGEQLTTLHWILRYLWNRHRGGLYIWPKQYSPYHMARRVAS